MAVFRPRAIGVGPLTAHEVSLHLGVHVNTVKRIPPDELPYYRFGQRGDRRYALESVQKYINLRAVGQTDRDRTHCTSCGAAHKWYELEPGSGRCNTCRP
jgi:hypothetical protein